MLQFESLPCHIYFHIKSTDFNSFLISLLYQRFSEKPVQDRIRILSHKIIYMILFAIPRDVKRESA